ncbi:hypothetical protein E3Q18_03813 [Wallemia mellicola]|nr:hypothetical protein E3Q18_03813 [Wallemia mellicola]
MVHFKGEYNSYRPNKYDMSNGLRRARVPFLYKNLLTGLVILTFTSTVYIYSIAAVNQDDFSDVKPMRRDKEIESISNNITSSSPPSNQPQHRGILNKLLELNGYKTSSSLIINNAPNL